MFLTLPLLFQIITIGNTFLKGESDASQPWDPLYWEGYDNSSH